MTTSIPLRGWADGPAEEKRGDGLTAFDRIPYFYRVVNIAAGKKIGYNILSEEERAGGAAGRRTDAQYLTGLKERNGNGRTEAAYPE